MQVGVSQTHYTMAGVAEDLAGGDEGMVESLSSDYIGSSCIVVLAHRSLARPAFNLS